MIKDASDVAPNQQKRHLTSAGTSVTEKSKLSLRAISTRRNALSLNFLQRRHVPPFPSNDSPEKTVAHTAKERYSSQTATMLIETKILKEIDRPTQLRRTSHSLPSLSRQKQDAFGSRTIRASFPLRITLGVRAALVVKRFGGMLPEALGPWMYTLLNGQAALALESIDIKDMCTKGGDELVFQEVDQRFPDKETADRMGEATEEAFWLKIIKKRDNGGFHSTVETCVYPSSVRGWELAIGSPRIHCLAWMSTWEPGTSNDHVCNPQKLSVR